MASISTPQRIVDRGDISNGEDTIVFRGVDELFRTVHSCTGDGGLTIQGLTWTRSDNIAKARDERGRKLRFHFRPDEKRLYISIPTWPHEIVHQELQSSLCYAFSDMGIDKKAFAFAGATTYGSGGVDGSDGSGGSGEGDTTFVPRERAGTAAKWPTLVIESGVSQSLASLRNKMAWWFRASDHEVKMVLLMKVDQDARRIRLWKYTKDSPQTRSGATRTRAMPNLEPHLRQEIQIAPQPDNGGPAQYDVIGGPLHLEFALLFLRPADPARGEHDIEISAGELAGVAEFVFPGIHT